MAGSFVGRFSRWQCHNLIISLRCTRCHDGFTLPWHRSRRCSTKRRARSASSTTPTSGSVSQCTRATLGYFWISSSGRTAAARNQRPRRRRGESNLLATKRPTEHRLSVNVYSTLVVQAERLDSFDKNPTPHLSPLLILKKGLRTNVWITLSSGSLERTSGIVGVAPSPMSACNLYVRSN